MRKRALLLFCFILLTVNSAMAEVAVEKAAASGPAAEMQTDKNTNGSTDLLKSLGLDLVKDQKEAPRTLHRLYDSFSQSFHQSAASVLQWRGFESRRLIASGIGLLFALILTVFVRWFIRRKLWRLTHRITHKGKAGVFCLLVVSPVSWGMLASGIFLGTLPITLCFSEGIFLVWEKIYLTVLLIAVVVLILNLFKLLDSALLKVFKRNEKLSSMDRLAVKVIGKVIQIVIILMAFFFLCENILGINITAVLAGAGVIGLGVAFAAQDTIANFFGSLMIIIDRPFKINDFIRLDGKEGVVERVGLRSTRIRTPDGFVVTIPNKTTANVTIEDVSLRPNIKRIMTLGLVYDTSPAKMEEAIRILHEILKHHAGVDQTISPKIHFLEFADYSLNIQVILWLRTNVLWDSLDWADEINHEILKRFNDSGIEFAFPTNTTYLAYDAKREVELKVRQPEK